MGYEYDTKRGRRLPTKRQKTFVRAMANGESIEKAGHRAGYVNAEGALKSEGVRTMFEDMGIDPPALDKKLGDIIHDRYIVTRTIDEDGKEVSREVTSGVEVPITLRAMDMAYKRTGGYAPDVHVNLTSDDIKAEAAARIFPEYRTESEFIEVKVVEDNSQRSKESD